MDDGSEQEVSLFCDDHGLFRFELCSEKGSFSVPIKPSQLHEVLSGKDVSVQSPACAASLSNKDGELRFTFFGECSVSFVVGLNRFGVLARSLGLAPPRI